MDVYPKDTRVSKGWIDKMKTGFKAGLSALSNLFRSNPQAEEVKDVVFEIPSREELAARGLQFYLEPYKSVLLQDGEHPKEYKVDSLVTEIVHIYFLLHKPWVNGHEWTIPLMATVSIPYFECLCVQCRLMGNCSFCR